MITVKCATVKSNQMPGVVDVVAVGVVVVAVVVAASVVVSVGSGQ